MISRTCSTKVCFERFSSFFSSSSTQFFTIQDSTQSVEQTWTKEWLFRVQSEHDLVNWYKTMYSSYREPTVGSYPFVSTSIVDERFSRTIATFFWPTLCSLTFDFCRLSNINYFKLRTKFFRRCSNFEQIEQSTLNFQIYTISGQDTLFGHWIVISIDRVH